MIKINTNSNNNKLKLLAIGAVVGFCNGLFGAGGGIIAVPAMVHFLKLKEHDAHSTAISIILPLTIVSTFIYFKNGHIDTSIILKVGAGETIGALLGAFLLHRISSKYLIKAFAIFIIITAIRMVV
ncbi:MAG: sulfite exporter TauE/SafE family protein [Caldicoprobacterales bacterium]